MRALIAVATGLMALASLILVLLAARMPRSGHKGRRLHGRGGTLHRCEEEPVTGFRVSAASLVGSAIERQIVGIIADHLRVTTGRSPSESERRSWRSLPILAHYLVEAGLGEIEMLIEYQLPLTSKRADVVLAGVDRLTGGDAYVVVGLKQWSQAELYEGNERLVIVEGMHREVQHRLLQVQGYCDYVADFVASLDGNKNAVRGVAYLHNAADLDVDDLFEFATTDRTRLFTKSRRGAFLEYLNDQFAPDRGAGAADRLLTSAVRPSRQLLKLAAAETGDREQRASRQRRSGHRFAAVCAHSLTGLAAILAGRSRRPGLLEEWLAHIAGHVGHEMRPWRKLMDALGFLIAAVYYRIQDAADLAWIPAEAILKSRALSNIFFIAPTATAALVIFHHDGITGVIKSADDISAVGAAAYALVRVGRWWRGVKPPDPEPRRSKE